MTVLWECLVVVVVVVVAVAVVVVAVVFYFQTAYNNISTMDSSLILILSITQFEAVARASGCCFILKFHSRNHFKGGLCLNTANTAFQKQSNSMTATRKNYMHLISPLSPFSDHLTL